LLHGRHAGPPQSPPGPLQGEYRAWLDNLPPNLESSALADKLQTIVELDLEELAAVDPPRGYGRD
jgi:hypothetical protein